MLQGMDVQFERMMYRQLIASSCNAKLSQYFLITPKLLNDLHYDDNITISFIFNGVHVDLNSKHLITSSVVKKRKRASEEGQLSLLNA